MYSTKGLLVCLILLGAVMAQTNFKNTCQNASLIPKLATGLIHLNPLDTYNNGANKDYYQDLALAQFAAVDVLGSGFALTGFQTGCSNTFYTLVIDKVIFENQNTRMRIVVNFRNPADGSITVWNLVSFTYIVVSRNLNGAYSDIWATVAETTNPTDSAAVAAIDSVGAAYQGATTAGDCRTYVDPSVVGSSTATVCVPGNLAAADGTGGGQNIVHAYIMGFMFNPARTTTAYLFAGVRLGVTPDGSEEPAVTIALTGANRGPSVTFLNPGNAIEYIKVAFVISRFDSQAVTAATYPATSLLLYSASYIYTTVTTFNKAIPIQRSTTAFNRLYYRLNDARYAIYGVTQFQIPKATTISCSTIHVNATLDSIDAFTITTPNTNPTDFFFTADIFTVNVDRLCTSTTTARSTVKTTVGQKSFFTVPTQSLLQYIQEQPDSTAVTGVTGHTSSPDNFYFQYYGAVNNGNNDTILFQAQVPYTDLTVGAPLKFEFGFFDMVAPISGTATAAMIENAVYKIQLSVNGFILYDVNYVATTTQTNRQLNILRGININSTTANVVITVSYVRSTTLDQNLWTYLKLTQFNSAYDPTTGCCTSTCPALTGLDVQIDPPTCVYCNTQAGLTYNPNNGTCTCISGYYLDATKTFQCYPCTALYCSICSATDPARCTSCVVGANLNNVTFTCTCGNGFFVNGTTCQKCPYQCQNCSSPNGACTGCVDPTRRDIAQNCRCITGFFDSGSVNCTACSQTCLTCTNASACTSCDTTRFRNLTGTVCSCMNGYYELFHTNLTRSCVRCNPECLTCTTSPALCTSCDPAKNRVSGVDNNGRQTCLCQPGFYSTPDGSCIQSNCNADPFCSQCEQGLKLCVQCLASRFRIIKLPESICVCMDGYYADSNNTCVPCASGCATCNSATNCTACVALATPSGNGACACPNQTFFTVSPDGVRYCAACGYKCQTCTNADTCTTCMPSYTRTADNKCICSPRNFIDSTGNCLPCANGCQNCSSATVCNSCIAPLLLQGNVCQASCNDGFTPLGSVCAGCSTGCLKCTDNLICYYCADNFYMYNGNCYRVCPAGTVGDSSSGNWVCRPCNEPCKTCVNHPSYCTSCLNGMGYLQTSGRSQSCVLSCVDGTYADQGVCQVCDFRCATCLGSATNCISCPDGQILYKGGCWATCPAIQMQAVGQNASCVDQCPDGFYRRSETSCAPCNIECTTCSGAPNNCTSCLHGSVSVNGSCSVVCGENEFSFQGICVACSASCYGCQFTPQNCLQCAEGYVRTGSICQRGCQSFQYFDNNQRRCISCGPGCATCTSLNFCTSCSNPAIIPRGGVCSNCPYPCATCDGSGACTTCLSGFSLFQGACQTRCPDGASSINGVCQCASGIVSQGRCVTSCGSGFTSIEGRCQPCNSNCAECSGNVNSCTRCISGFSIDTATRRCVAQAKCPYGQDLSNGACANICEPGFFFYEGICIYGGCFNGYAPNSNGGCVRQTQVSTGPQCNANQFIQSGRCVGSCDNGFYPDSTSRECRACSANCVSCFNPSFCIICSTGFEMQNGVCVRATSCPSNQFQYNGNCVNTCPIGTFLVGSQCFRSCPAGNYYLSQICYISCPTSLRTEEACVSQCPPGTSNNNGVCQ